MTEIVGVEQVAALLRPEFVERDGSILLSEDAECGRRNRESFESNTELEAGCTHVHVLDYFDNAAFGGGELEDDQESLFQSDHPHFQAACRIGVAMVSSWAAKLAADFPGRSFRVYYTELDNPIVRFHQVRAGEAFWLSDEEVVAVERPNRAAVVDTRTNQLVISSA